MFALLRKPTTLLLLATLMLVAGGGEALHSLPGCGHGVWVGDRVILLGISSTGPARTDDGKTHVDRPADQEIPILDPAECVICSVVGQFHAPGGFHPVAVDTPLAGDLLVTTCDVWLATYSLPHQARAPPRV